MYYNKFPTSRGRQMAWCFTLQRDSTTVKSIKLHTQTQSKGLNFYFENRDVQQIPCRKYVDILSCAGIGLLMIYVPNLVR